jgi:hypothetical protein
MTRKIFALTSGATSTDPLNATPITEAEFDGGIIIDRVLEDVNFIITPNDDDTFTLKCTKQSDLQYLKDICLDMEKFSQKVDTFFTSEESFLMWEDQNGDWLDVLIWDDTTPFPEYARIVP